MFALRIVVLLLSVCFSISAIAAEPATKLPEKKTPRTKKIQIDTNRALRIQYRIPEWDKDPAQIESGTAIMKDAKSGQRTTIELTETAPDSGIFSGVFFVSTGKASEYNPEIYIPKVQITSTSTPEEAEKLLKPENLDRKPFIHRKTAQGDQQLIVFNTKDEVATALKDSDFGEGVVVPKKIEAAKALLEAAELAKIEAEKKRLAEEAAKQAAERTRMEELERKKQEELKKRAAALAAKERAKRKKEAEGLAKQAIEQFKQQKFVEAESLFRKANELDPENQTVYYRWGISLFRLEKFQDSLVALKLSEGPDVDPAEKQFYIGLILMRQKENVAALKTFRDLKATKHQVYGPNGAFYEGLILFNDLKYEESKNAFQEVLDTSSDPRLDEKADEYIDKINRIQQFAANKEKTFLFGASIGTQYDSNILLDPSQADSGTPTNGGGMRYIAGGSIGWRPVYEKDMEFAVNAKGDTIYSADSKFVAADPLLWTVQAPFKYRGMIIGKQGQTEVKPGVEMLYLDTSKTGTKKSYQDSTTFDWATSWVMNDDWMTAANLKYRADKAKDPSSTGDNDNTAAKISLNWNNIFFQNKKKTKAYIGDLTYISNAAVGKQLYYTRFDVGAGMLFPFEWETQGVVQLAYFSADYSKRDDGRKDQNLSLTASFSKPIKDWMSSALSLNWTNNNSNVKANAYQKYSATLLFTFNTGL